MCQAAVADRCTVLAGAPERWSAELTASADRRFAELLGALAEHSPAPGAGSAVAWSAALAAALLEMASTYAGLDDVRARAAVLRGELLEAGQLELHAYEPVLAASSDQERREALSAASAVPVTIVRVSSELAELGARVVNESKPALKGDAVAGVLLAEAAARAAARLVEINLAGEPEDRRLAEVARLSERAARARGHALKQSA
jgi:methenyltetrahydrofolate cyclohydrolase